MIPFASGRFCCSKFKAASSIASSFSIFHHICTVYLKAECWSRTSVLCCQAALRLFAVLPPHLIKSSLKFQEYRLCIITFIISGNKRNSTCAIHFLQYQNYIICVSSKLLCNKGEIVYCSRDIKFLILNPSNSRWLRIKSPVPTPFYGFRQNSWQLFYASELQLNGTALFAMQKMAKSRNSCSQPFEISTGVSYKVLNLLTLILQWPIFKFHFHTFFQLALLSNLPQLPVYPVDIYIF